MHPSVLPIAGVRTLAHGHARGTLPQRHRIMDQQSDPRFGGADHGPLYGSGRIPARADRSHALNRPRPIARLCRKAGGRPLLHWPGGGQAPAMSRRSLKQAGPGQSSYQVHDEDVTAAAVYFLNQMGCRSAPVNPKAPSASASALCCRILPIWRGVPVRLLPGENSPACGARAFWRSPPPGNPLVAGPRRVAGRARGMGAQRPSGLLGLGPPQWTT